VLLAALVYEWRTGALDWGVKRRAGPRTRSERTRTERTRAAPRPQGGVAGGEVPG
jgi:hypothetical protein